MGATVNRRTRARGGLLGGLVAAGLLLAPVSASLAQQPPTGAGQPGAPPSPSPTPSPSGQPQEQQPQQPQQQQQQQQPGLTFSGDAGIILMQVKPDKTSDFEAVMGKLHEALTKTDKPERRQQATGWKVYKASEPGPGGNVWYVAIVDPVLKGADYTVAKILYEVFPTEVQAIFPTYRDSFASGMNLLNLQLVQDFGGPAKQAPPLPAGTAPAPGATDSGTSGTSGGSQPSPTTPNQ